MCEPVTLASAGLMLVGTAVSAYGQYEQSRAQSKAHDINAKILERAARDAIRRGAREAGAVREQATQIIGAQTTAAGASGVALDSDVVQSLAKQSRALSELDVSAIQWNAAREAWGLRMGAAQERQAAWQAIRAGNLAMGTTILTGVGQVGMGVAQAFLRPASSPPSAEWGAAAAAPLQSPTTLAAPRPPQWRNRAWGLGGRTNNPWL